MDKQPWLHGLRSNCAVQVSGVPSVIRGVARLWDPLSEPMSGVRAHLLAVMYGAPDSLLRWGLSESRCVLVIRATSITSFWREALLMVEGRNWGWEVLENSGHSWGWPHVHCLAHSP